MRRRPLPVEPPERRQPFEPTPLSSGLSQRVLELCDSVIEMGLVAGEARAELAEVRSQLAAPLRMAVVGARAAAARR